MGDLSRFVAFYTEPARYEISDSIVNIRLRSGTTTTEMAMPLCIFSKNVERAQRALERVRAGDAGIIIIDD